MWLSPCVLSTCLAFFAQAASALRTSQLCLTSPFRKREGINPPRKVKQLPPLSSFLSVLSYLTALSNRGLVKSWILNKAHQEEIEWGWKTVSLHLCCYKKQHRLVNLNNRGWEVPEQGARRFGCLVYDTSLLCHHMAEGVSEPCGVSLIRAWIPLGGFPLFTLLQRFHFLIPSH